MPCQPNDPCYTACDDCNDIIEPCLEVCATPIYTEIACLNPINDDCVSYTGADNACLGILKPIREKTVFEKVILFVRGLFSNITSNSLVFTPTQGTCTKTGTIELVPSANIGNILILGTDGRPFVPVASAINIQDTSSIDLTGNGNILTPLKGDVKISTNAGNQTSITPSGIFTPATTIPTIDYCSVFSNNVQQNNTVDSTTYQFLGLNNTSCGKIKITAPTGFAVTGSARVSAFGTMEWFSTLTAANIAASVGETVLIFNDTIEPLIAKTGVNYEGIGIHKIGQLAVNNYIGKIINLTIDMNLGTVVTPAITWSGTSNIEFTNVTILTGTNIKELRFVNNVVVKGGIYYVSVNLEGDINQHPKLSNCILYGDHNILFQLSTLEKFYLENNELTNPSGNTLLYAQGSSTNRDLLATVKDGLIISKSYHCFDTIFSVVIANIVAENINGRGIYIHSGSDTNNCNVIVTGCTGKSKTNVGFSSVANNAITFEPNAVTNINISNCTGFSTLSTGILLANGNLRNCYGYSETSYGINIGSSDRPSSNSHIIDCVGESRDSVGLKIDRDCFVYGGTFISRGISSAGNPISVREDTGNVRTDNYNLIGVKTLQHSTTAFSIKNAGHLPSIRISGCQFTNPYLATNVPGIDPTLTLRAIATDVYGNVR